MAAAAAAVAYDDEWLDAEVQRLRKTRPRVGHRLQALRHEQDSDDLRPLREWYSAEHLRRLLRFQARSVYPEPGTKVLCTTVHGPSCKACTTCHFCRQKTVDVKTWCPCARARGLLGGPHRGFWCGACLQGRMGENLFEALERCSRGEWRCPACRDICNCSGRDCLRLSRGWLKTGVLTHEARDCGYASVAHYLILTRWDDARAATQRLPRLDADDVAQMQQRFQDAAARELASAVAAQQLAAAGLQRQLNQAQRQALRSRASAADARKQRFKQACRVAAQPPDGELQQLMQRYDLGLDLLDVGTADNDEPQGGGPAGAVGGSRGAGGPPQQAAAARGAHARAGCAASRQPAPGSGVGQLAREAPGSSGPSPQAGNAASPEQAAAAGAAAPPPPMLGVLGISSLMDDAAGLSEQPPAGPSVTPLPTGPAVTPTPLRAAAGAPGEAAHAPSSGGPGTGGRSGPGEPQPPAGAARPAGSREPSPPPPPLQEQRRWAEPDTSFGAEDLPATDAPGYAQPGARGAHRAAAAGGQPRQQRQHMRNGAEGGRLTGGAPQRALDLNSLRPVGAAPPPQRRAAHAAQAAAAPPLESAAEPRAVDGGELSAGDEAGWMAGGDAGATMLQAPVSPAAGEARYAAAQGMLDDRQAAAEAAAAAAAAAGPPQPPEADVGAGEGAAGTSPAAATADDAGAAAAYAEAAAEAHAVPAAAGAGPPRPILPPPQGVLVTQRARVAALLELADALLDEPDLRAAAAGRARLVCAAQHVVDAAFYSNPDFDVPLVVNHMGAERRGSGRKLQAACGVLADLGALLPLECVAGDVARRLSGDEPFLDFSASDPRARSLVIDAATSLLQRLSDRSNWEAAVQEALLAAVAASPAGAPPPSAHALAAAALDAMAAAQDSMAAVLDAVLRWVAVLHEEVLQLQEWLESPKDLLGPVACGPVQWPSARGEGTAGAPTAGHAATIPALRRAQAGHDSQEAADRLEQLRALRDADEALLTSIAAGLMRELPFLPRTLVCGTLLGSSQLPALLDLGAHYAAPTRRAALALTTAAVSLAAPDVRAASAQWCVEAPQELQRLLQEHAAQQQQPVPAAADWLQLWDSCEDLLAELLQQELPEAARVAEVAAADAAVRAGLLLPRVEMLVAADYFPRQAWALGKYAHLLPPQPQQQQQQSLTAQLQPRWGGAEAAAGAQPAAAGGPAALDAKALQAHEQHCKQLGTSKVVALARLYALQLQAGSVAWAGMEAQLVAPASSLRHLLEVPKHLELRCMALVAVMQMVRAAPSLVAPHGMHGGGGPAIPELWLLQLWLGGMFDLHGRRRLLAHATETLASTPATALLFAGQSWQGVFAAHDAHDAGCARAALVRAVAAGVSRHGLEPAARLLGGLPGVLAARQQEARDEQRRQDAELAVGSPGSAQLQAASLAQDALLLWQRGCTPALAALAELLGGLCGSRFVPPSQQLRQQVFGPASDGQQLAQLLLDLLRCASRWMQAGVQQVCRLRAAGPASEGGAQPAAGGAGGAVSASADAFAVIKASALYHLPAHLGVVVNLAGRGWQLDGVAASHWPADASGGGALLGAVVASGAHAPPGIAAPGGWQPHAPAAAAQPSLPCVSELLMAVVEAPSAADEPPPCEAALFARLAAVLAAAGGVSAAACTPGYSSPGLLHLLLGTHVRLLLEDAAGKPGVALAQRRAVNALHLLRALLRQPGVLGDASRRLLLPTVVRPLSQLLAAPPGGCAAAQYQVFRLLEQLLLAAPPAPQLLPQPGAEAAGGACPDPQHGPLRSMAPVDEPLLRQLLLLLLTLGLQKAVSLVAALDVEFAPKLQGSLQTRLTASMAALAQQQHQAPMAAAGLQLRVLLLSDQDAAAARDALQRVVNGVLGWMPAVGPHLKPALTAVPAGGGLGGGAGSLVARPADYSLTLLLHGVALLQRAVAAGGAAQQAACQRLKNLRVLVTSLDMRRTAPHGLVQGYQAILDALPPGQRTPYELRTQMQPPASRPPQRQRQQQQQQAPPALSQHAARIAASAGGVGAGLPASQRGRVVVPESSQASLGGGRAASCCVAESSSPTPLRPAARQPLLGAHAVSAAATVPQPHAALPRGASQSTIPQPHALPAAAAGAAASGAPGGRGGSKRSSSEVREGSPAGSDWAAEDEADSATVRSGSHAGGQGKRRRASPPVDAPQLVPAAQQHAKAKLSQQGEQQLQQQQQQLDVHSQDQGPQQPTQQQLTPQLVQQPSAPQRQAGSQQAPATQPSAPAAARTALTLLGDVTACTFKADAAGAAGSGGTPPGEAELVLGRVPIGGRAGAGVALSDLPVRLTGRAAAAAKALWDAGHLAAGRMAGVTAVALGRTAAGRLRVLGSEGSQLLLDPDATAAACADAATADAVAPASAARARQWAALAAQLEARRAAAGVGSSGAPPPPQQQQQQQQQPQRAASPVADSQATIKFPTPPA